MITWLQSELSVSSNRERARLWAIGRKQVEALAERPGDDAAGRKRADAIGKPCLSSLDAVPKLVDRRQRRVNPDTHVLCEGWTAIADDQVQQRPNRLIRPDINPYVWLGSFDA
jgi:hypothetical protein